MSEGTKLGEFDNHQDFKSSMDTGAGSDDALKGTKIGELSEFEKAILGDEGSKKKPEAAKESQAQDTQEAATETKEEVKAEAPVAEPKQETQTQVQEDNQDMSFFESELDRLDVDIEEGDIVEGTVRAVEKSGVFVDIGFKSEGFIANDEFSHDPTESAKDVVKPGDIISAFVEKLETKQGYTKLSKKKAEYENGWNEVLDLSRSKDLVGVFVASKVQGGLVAEYKGIKGFIPASHIVKDGEQPLDDFIKCKLNVVVLKADRNRRKVIFSHKMAENKRSRADVEALLDNMDIGQILDGKVSSIKDFGAFIDLGGIEGLVHISELSWARISHPTDVLAQGQDVKVFVLGVDKENRRISLGMKQLEPDPWVKAAEKYSVGDVVKGKVTRVVTFGAFVLLEDHLEGLVHISELSNEHVKEVSDVVTAGDEINATIIKVIPDEQKIGLSLKSQSEETPEETTEEVAEVEAESEEAVVEEAEGEEATEAPAEAEPEIAEDKQDETEASNEQTEEVKNEEEALEPTT